MSRVSTNKANTAQAQAQESAAKKAVVLISGGLDSATCLAIAKDKGFDCYGLSFDYGQRAESELQAATKIAAMANVIEHKTITLNIGELGGSALTDTNIDIPEQPDQTAADRTALTAEQNDNTQQIPVTYVPARNTVFLSYALAWAEVLSAEAIYIGVNALDYSGYPDCRPEFIASFQALASLATKAGVEGKPVTIATPLIAMSKAQIIITGSALGVDFKATVSCYQSDAHGRACGRCDSCRFRKQGFQDAGVVDPTIYQ